MDCIYYLNVTVVVSMDYICKYDMIIMLRAVFKEGEEDLVTWDNNCCTYCGLSHHHYVIPSAQWIFVILVILWIFLYMLIVILWIFLWISLYMLIV